MTISKVTEQQQPKITKAEILENFTYIKNDGVLVWKKFVGGKSEIGKIAGHCNGGYNRVTINGKNFQTRKLIYFLETGIYPYYPLSKKDDSIKSDNFENLLYRPRYLSEVTKELLLEWVDYDRSTGEFHWKKSGEKLCSTNNKKIPNQNIFGFKVRSTSLVWFAEHGVWRKTDAFIHIDGNKTNCQIDNLAETDQAETMQSDVPYKTNKSGHRGVFFNKLTKKWSANLQVRGESYLSQSLNSLEEALAKRIEFENKHFSERRLQVLRNSSE